MGITRKGAWFCTFNVENFLVLCTLLIWFFVDSKLYHKNGAVANEKNLQQPLLI
nr:MAG TPA: hypothetical protein [Caudoviricetes sp.]